MASCCFHRIYCWPPRDLFGSSEGPILSVLRLDRGWCSHSVCVIVHVALAGNRGWPRSWGDGLFWPEQERNPFTSHIPTRDRAQLERGEERPEDKYLALDIYLLPSDSHNPSSAVELHVLLLKRWGWLEPGQDLITLYNRWGLVYPSYSHIQDLPPASWTEDSDYSNHSYTNPCKYFWLLLCHAMEQSSRHKWLHLAFL